MIPGRFLLYLFLQVFLCLTIGTVELKLNIPSNALSSLERTHNTSSYTTIHIEVCDDCDWKQVCVEATRHVTDLPLRYSICNMIGWQKNRLNQKVHKELLFTVTENDNGVDIATPVKVEVRRGDDIGMLIWYLLKKYPNISSSIQAIAYHMIGPDILPVSLTGSDEWIRLRSPGKNDGRELVQLLLPHTHSNTSENFRNSIQNNTSANSDPTINFSQEGMNNELTIGITTCRRFNLYIRTLESLERLVPDLTSLGRVIVVDDSSSDEDRSRMLNRNPSFEFVFKTQLERGHAVSMNILLSKLNTRYFIYIEDDWELSETVSFRILVQQAMCILTAYAPEKRSLQV